MEEIDCVIMAGGKATRFNFKELGVDYNEKSILPIKDRRLIDWVIEPLRFSKFIRNIYVAITNYTPKTQEYLIEKYQDQIILVQTPGKDFQSDLKYIIKARNLEHVIVFNSDLPLLDVERIDDIIISYFEENIPAFSVMVDLETAGKIINLEENAESIYTDENKNKLYPVGINIINGRYIEEDFIEQKEYISNDPDLLFNINTLQDYRRFLEYISSHQIMNIFLIRHTEVDLIEPICYGYSDVPIKSTFTQEAEFVKERIPLDENLIFYSSPSKRCVELTKFLTTAEFSMDKRLCEMNFGDWEGIPWNDLEKQEEFKNWADNFVEEKAPNGESYQDQVFPLYCSCFFMSSLSKKLHLEV